MIDFIINTDEFERYKARFHTLFHQKDFEKNPFKDAFKYFAGFEFDFIYHKSFFEGLKVFLSKIGSEFVTFYTISPPPESYFYRRFEKYSVFEISSLASDSDLNEIMTKNPDEDSFDSICASSDEIAWFSESDNWAILGSRDWEIAIIGFTDIEVMKKFTLSFREEAQTMFTSIKTQADALNDMLCFNEQIKADYDKLVDHYRNKV